jgi:hypothetical protein
MDLDMAKVKRKGASQQTRFRFKVAAFHPMEMTSTSTLEVASS